MTSAIGMRVGVIYKSDVEEKLISFFGYGNYLGDYIPEEGFSSPNPKIILDSGEVVYGYQCWWGSEFKVREDLQNFILKGYRIEEVRPSEVFK